MNNPFPKLTAEARRHPDDKRLLDELGAYFTSVVMHKPRNKRYDFYEYLEKEGSDDLPGVHGDVPTDRSSAS